MEAAGIWPIKEYIQRQQATISVKVAYPPIYELCTGAEQIPGSSWMISWRDQGMGCEEE